jgi:hypothetical protein
MGFTNEEKSLKFLEKFNGNVSQVSVAFLNENN